jgi:hypothetical protein
MSGICPTWAKKRATAGGTGFCGEPANASSAPSKANKWLANSVVRRASSCRKRSVM